MSVPEQELDRLLRSMRADARPGALPDGALPDGALDELRRGVRARIRRTRQRRVLAWCASAAAVVFVGLTVAPLWQSLPKLDARAPRVEAVELAWRRASVNPPMAHPQTPRPQTPAKRSAGKTPAQPVEQAHARPRFEVAEQPGFIRVVTRDPSVVVLWAMDEVKVEEEPEKSEKKGVTR